MAEMGDNNDGKPWSPPTSFEEYRLLWPLGRGGMGEVFLGHDTVLDRPVAIKFVTNLDADQQTRERYLIEARAAARLQHPNVVTIYRVGEIESHPYIIAEYVQGQDLQALPKPVPWQFGLELAIGLSRGLAAAHKRGVLHRDLKPANAILADNGEVKLLDFGLAKYVDNPNAVAVRWKSREVIAPTMEATESGHFPPVAQEVGKSNEISVKISVEQAALSAAQLVPLPAAFPAIAQSDDQFRPVDFQGSQPHMSASEPSRSSQIKGTPIYMAPERLLGAPATRRSDVYSMGALLYELLAGVPPHFDVPFEKLPLVVPEQDVTPLSHLAPSCDPQFAQVVDRCLKRNPAERYASGEELQTALEQVEKGKHSASLPDGNPYRGMLAYDADHRGLFFGRRGDIGTLIDRLRTESVAAISGEGGSGKTSIVRAGLLPLLGEGALGGGRRWRTLSTQPGRHPLDSLSDVLAEALGPRTEQSNVRRQLEDAPEEVRALLHKRTTDRRGIVLFVDQLEDVLTHGTPKDAQVYFQVLSVLFERHSGLRLILAVQSQAIAAMVPWTQDLLDWNRDVYHLRPLSRERLQEIITAPAKSKGVSFSSPQVVEDLLDFATQSESGLSLLSVVLSELWDAKEGMDMSAMSVRSIGGIAGAMSRHADHVLSSLPRERRLLAKKLLLLLRSPDGLPLTRSEEELFALDLESPKALRALHCGRLLSYTDSPKGLCYRISHPVFLSDWPTLQRWLDDQGPKVPSRPSIPPPKVKETPFWRQATRFAWAVLPTVVFLFGLSVWDHHRRSQLERKTAIFVKNAQEIVQQAHAKQALSALYQKQALEMLDGPRPDKVNEQWDLAKQSAGQAERLYGHASQTLEQSLVNVPEDSKLRDELARVLYQRAWLAEWLGEAQLLEDFLRRIPLYDERGTWMSKWQKQSRLSLSSEPKGALVAAERYVFDAQGRWTLSEEQKLGKTPILGAQLAPGSYLLRISLEGRRDVRLPMIVGHDEEHTQHVNLP